MIFPYDSQIIFRSKIIPNMNHPKIMRTSYDFCSQLSLPLPTAFYLFKNFHSNGVGIVVEGGLES